MTITNDVLVLYADNRLSDERKAYPVDSAAHDADLAETLAALDASHLPYKTAFENKALSPLPEKLRIDVENLACAELSGASAIHGDLNVASSWIEGNQRLFIVTEEFAKNIQALYDGARRAFLEA